MELRQLKTFRTVATMLSFTRAAAALDYVQSSVTAQIQALEEELGLPLFDRLGNGYRSPMLAPAYSSMRIGFWISPMKHAWRCRAAMSLPAR